MIQTKNSFARNSMITLTRQFLSIIIGMLLLVILARLLGPSGQGKYTTITLLPTLLMTFLNLGMNVSTIYYVSKGEVDLNTAVKNNFYYGLTLSLISLVIGVIIIFGFSGAFFKDIEPQFLYICLIALPFMMLNIFFQTVFQGLQDFKSYNTILVVTQFSTLLFTGLLIWVFKFGLVGSLVAFILGQLITTIYTFYLFIGKYHVKMNQAKFSYSYLKKTLVYGIKSHISNVVTVLNYRTALLMLVFFLNPVAVGIFSVAVNLAERLSIFSQSISSVLLPRIASEKSDKARNQLTAIISRNLLVFMLIGMFVGILLSNFIITIFFGKQYQDSVSLLQVLLPGVAFLSIERILSNDIAGRGKPEVNMYVSIFNIILNVILNLIFIPKYGAFGAALATSITYIVSFIIKVNIYKRLTGASYSSILILKREDIVLYRKLLRGVKHKLRRVTQ